MMADKVSGRWQNAHGAIFQESAKYTIRKMTVPESSFFFPYLSKTKAQDISRTTYQQTVFLFTVFFSHAESFFNPSKAAGTSNPRQSLCSQQRWTFLLTCSLLFPFPCKSLIFFFWFQKKLWKSTAMRVRTKIFPTTKIQKTFAHLFYAFKKNFQYR